MAKNLRSLEEIIFYSLVGKDCNKSPEEVAGEMGIKYNTLMRKASFTDEGTSLNVHELIPFMRAAGNFTVLDKLNEMAGRLYIPHPRGIRKGTNPKMDVYTYQSEFSAAMKLLHLFLAEPTDENYTELNEALQKHIGDTVNMQRRTKKHLLHQTEMDF